jgi:hypothetical protein
MRQPPEGYRAGTWSPWTEPRWQRAVAVEGWAVLFLGRPNSGCEQCPVMGEGCRPSCSLFLLRHFLHVSNSRGGTQQNHIIWVTVTMAAQVQLPGDSGIPGSMSHTRRSLCRASRLVFVLSGSMPLLPFQPPTGIDQCQSSPSRFVKVAFFPKTWPRVLAHSGNLGGHRTRDQLAKVQPAPLL